MRALSSFPITYSEHAFLLTSGQAWYGAGKTVKHEQPHFHSLSQPKDGEKVGPGGHDTSYNNVRTLTNSVAHPPNRKRITNAVISLIRREPY